MKLGIYVEEIRDYCVQAMSSLNGYAGEDQKAADAHGPKYSQHAEKLLAVFYSRLAKLRLLSKPNKSPMELMHSLCALLRDVRRETHAVPFGIKCAAWISISGVEGMLQAMVRDVSDTAEGARSAVYEDHAHSSYKARGDRRSVVEWSLDADHRDLRTLHRQQFLWGWMGGLIRVAGWRSPRGLSQTLRSTGSNWSEVRT